jgi:hypothetical protein
MPEVFRSLKEERNFEKSGHVFPLTAIAYE